MVVRLTVDVGKDGGHIVDFETEGETLIPSLTWCKSHPILDWTIKKLEDAAEQASSEYYPTAEQQFMHALLGFTPKLKGP